ncbi:MAG: glycosyltransferase family 2 protein [Capsulimonadaceae bacterium]|nr:glycosyltransferase family 2 protein [Capsulimonadaceae bacterium]
MIIPAFNEEARLPITLNATREYLQERFPEQCEILVVDDGSADATAHITAEFAKHYPDVPVSVLSYGCNRGKGYAVRYGMLHASGDWRLFCDADLATPIEEFAVIFDRMKVDGTEIGIGSRPLKQSNLLVHQPWYREQLGRGFNKVVQMLAVPGIQDTQCGFKIFSAAAATNVFQHCKLDKFAFDAEALLIATRLGYRISEVPIRWSHKDGSKISLVRDGSRMVCDLLRIRMLHKGLKRVVK